MDFIILCSITNKKNIFLKTLRTKKRKEETHIFYIIIILYYYQYTIIMK